MLLLGYSNLSKKRKKWVDYDEYTKNELGEMIDKLDDKVSESELALAQKGALVDDLVKYI